MFWGCFCHAFQLRAIWGYNARTPLGERNAVLIESPIILSMSWKTAIWVLQQLHALRNERDLLVMGLLAFIWLMVAEMLLAVVAFDNISPPQMIGLMEQKVYGKLPFLESKRARKRLRAKPT